MYILSVSSDDKPTDALPSWYGVGVFPLLVNSRWSWSRTTWTVGGIVMRSSTLRLCLTSTTACSAATHLYARWSHAAYCKYHQGPVAPKSCGRFGLTKQNYWFSNLIEYVWDFIKRELNNPNTIIRNVVDLCLGVHWVWNDIPKHRAAA